MEGHPGHHRPRGPRHPRQERPCPAAREAEQSYWFDFAAKDVTGAQASLTYAMGNSKSFPTGDNWNILEGLLNQYLPLAFSGSGDAGRNSGDDPGSRRAGPVSRRTARTGRPGDISPPGRLLICLQPIRNRSCPSTRQARSRAPPATRRRDARTAFWFLLPSLIGFLLFMLYPARRLVRHELHQLAAHVGAEDSSASTTTSGSSPRTGPSTPCSSTRCSTPSSISC